MFKIDKHGSVPEPEKKNKKASVKKALSQMDIGDSFVMPSPFIPTWLYSEAKGQGVSVSLEKIADGKYRIWRKA